jgi:uncharacterized protein (DUF58 family)
MNRLPLPSPPLILTLMAFGALLTGMGFAALPDSWMLAAWLSVAGLLLLVIGLDVRLTVRAWRDHPLKLKRRLPRAFAVGTATRVEVTLENSGPRACRGQLFESTDPSLILPAAPLPFDVPAGRSQTLQFDITPTRRGLKQFAPAQLRLRSRLRLLDWNLPVGPQEQRRVFPNFKLQSAFELLTGKQQLAEMGIKSIRRRGSATDFDELVEYRPGDELRHIDWKATLRHQRVIVRRYQEDRDQSVMFLLDCGRRMRADDSQAGIGATHFDQALNALMLLAYVALSKGDAVGALTFGTPEAEIKRFSPRKGRHSLNALMAELGGVEPLPHFSDYVQAASDCLRRHHKRGLLVLITNCRDEDTPELTAALRLLKTRHLVVLASLRESIVSAIASQSLKTDEQALESAAALEYEQRRRDSLMKMAMNGVILIDCEPRQLGVQLVNHYTALKRSGAL